LAQVRAVNPQGHDGDARLREVGQAHSTCEVPEQRRPQAGGGDGGKGLGQGEMPPTKQATRTQSRERPAQCVGRHAFGSPLPHVGSKARARCGNSARRDLRGGRRATAVPTATAVSNV
jgi:hypothetical protein